MSYQTFIIIGGSTTVFLFLLSGVFSNARLDRFIKKSTAERLSIIVAVLCVVSLVVSLVATIFARGMPDGTVVVDKQGRIVKVYKKIWEFGKVMNIYQVNID